MKIHDKYFTDTAAGLMGATSRAASAFKVAYGTAPQLAMQRLSLDLLRIADVADKLSERAVYVTDMEEKK
jgi:hypothetical protein